MAVQPFLYFRKLTGIERLDLKLNVGFLGATLTRVASFHDKVRMPVVCYCETCDSLNKSKIN